MDVIVGVGGGLFEGGKGGFGERAEGFQGVGGLETEAGVGVFEQDASELGEGDVAVLCVAERVGGGDLDGRRGVVLDACEQSCGGGGALVFQHGAAEGGPIAEALVLVGHGVDEGGKIGGVAFDGEVGDLENTLEGIGLGVAGGVVAFEGGAFGDEAVVANAEEVLLVGVAHSLEDRLVVGAVGEIVDLIGVGLEVVEFLLGLVLPEELLGADELALGVKAKPGLDRGLLEHVGDMLALDEVGVVVADVAVTFIAGGADEVVAFVHAVSEGEGILLVWGLL